MDVFSADVLSSPADSREPAVPGRALPPFEPFHIDSYYVVERLGDGGMGVVYLAEQDEPIQRRVTIKCIRHDLADPEAVKRFELERQTLAAMTHPNIAGIYDAGSMSDGRPYFVMEYVQGPSLTQYCFNKRLGLAGRIALMIAVCEAVQYAHHNGVIHRDLKPANILVTDVHGRPAPKIIDFGIARAINASRADGEFAHWLSFVGTPQYMSPEQHGWTRRSVDTRTDIYSIGVLLYELLCGFLPDELQIAKMAGISEPALLRRLRPSEQVHNASMNVAENRGFRNNRALSRVLRGDLDAVIQKAIAADPAERYQTPLSLASDLQRFLEHRPISIRQSRRLYTTRKLIRRNVAATLIGVTGVFALVVLSAALAMQLRLTEIARREAEDAARRYTALHEIIAQVFRAGVPRNGERHDLSAEDLLEGVASRLEEELFTDPVGRAPLLADVAGFYGSIGMHATAETLSRRIVRALTTVLGKHHPRTAYAEARFAWVLAQAGQYREARGLLEKSIEVLHEHYGDGRLETLNAEVSLAFTRLYMGEPAEAEDIAAHVIGSIRSRRLEGEPIHADALNASAEAMAARGDFVAAEAAYVEALTASKNLYGPAHQHTHIVVNGLAHARQSLGDMEGAEKIYRDELAYVAQVMGEDHEDTAILRSNLGFNLLEQSRYREAIEHLARAHETINRELGRDHPKALAILLNLARAKMHVGETGPARALLTEVLDERLRIFGERHPNVANARNFIGQSWFLEGNYVEALRWQEEALHVFEEQLGVHWRTGEAGVRRAESLIRLGRIEAADVALQKAFAILEATLGAEHPKCRASAARIAAMYEELGYADRAAAYRVVAAE